MKARKPGTSRQKNGAVRAATQTARFIKTQYALRVCL